MSNKSDQEVATLDEIREHLHGIPDWSQAVLRVRFLRKNEQHKYSMSLDWPLLSVRARWYFGEGHFTASGVPAHYTGGAYTLLLHKHIEKNALDDIASIDELWAKVKKLVGPFMYASPVIEISHISDRQPSQSGVSVNHFSIAPNGSKGDVREWYEYRWGYGSVSGGFHSYHY